MNKILEVNNLTFAYDKNLILDNISFEINEETCWHSRP